MCDNDNNEPSGHVVTCAFCKGSGRNPPLGLAPCPKCDGAGKKVIK